MMEFVPVALACGHLLQEETEFEMTEDGIRLRCPECLEMVKFVIEPDGLEDDEK